MKRTPARVKKINQGYSLVEVLLVIGIIGILAILSMFTYREQIAKGHDARRKEDLLTIKAAVEQYYDDFGCYPPPEMVVCASTDLDPYTPIVPCDPSNKGSYVYFYDRQDCSNYAIFTRLANEADEKIDQLGCVNGCGPQATYNYYLSTVGYLLETGTATSPTPTPSGYYGDVLEPNCDWGCNPGACVNCCPGQEYRCNAAGTQCIYDTSCSAN